MLVIHIRDSGIGIAPENHHKIFKRFGKLKNPNSSQVENQNGIGLGLAYC